MTKILSDYPLNNLNTFRVKAKAKLFAEISSFDSLIHLLADPNLRSQPILALGSGSNTLFRHDYGGLVLKLNLKGRRIVKQSTTHVIVELGAGENWPDFVTWAVDNHLGGVENLALIPGTLGAAPVQNIAAYGQNLSDVLDSVEAIDSRSLGKKRFTNKDCQFAYRDSVFKHSAKNFIITSVRLKLTTSPVLETDYFSIGGRRDSIKKELAAIAPPPYDISHVYQAVTNIRRRKLPDPATTPTVGSFFINPVVTKTHLTNLRSQISDLQFYPANQLKYKQLGDPDFDKLTHFTVPAGRLLQELGWDHRRLGHCHTYHGWASIITHDGQATGQEIYDLVTLMKQEVRKKYKINLQSEVTII